MSNHANLPRKRWLVLRLGMLFAAVALSVGLQVGEGEAAGPAEQAPKPAAEKWDVGCAAPVALKHPALPAVDQSRDARSSDASSNCSRPARSGS